MNNTIFVISQNREIQVILEYVLSSMNYNVKCFYDVCKAQKNLRQIPDLIYFDIDSQTENFSEPLSFLSENLSTDIPIIALTEPDENIRKKALDSGVTDFLSKPIEKTELQSRTNLCLKAYYKKAECNSPEPLGIANIGINFFEKDKVFSVSTIKHLIRVCALRDKNTCAHAIRVAYYSAALSRKLGFNDIAISAIFDAASMHDVGKVAIPDQILLKPGSLNADEIQVVKTHPGHGHFILEGSDTEFVRLAESIALYHHERWDGSGYPNNIKKEKIPLVARIVAIVDVFDALVSKRCYKKPFSLEQTYQIIREGCDTHFDSRIVSMFFDIQPEILSIKEKLNDENVYRSLIENSKSCIPLYSKKPVVIPKSIEEFNNNKFFFEKKPYNPALNSDAKGFRSLSLPPPFCAG